MDNNISEIEDLIKQFSKLPGLGPKSAKRIILKLINNKDNMIKPLAKSLAGVYKKVVRCSNCGNLKIIDKTCLCETDTNYDKICIVENLADMWVIESANIYKGHYHILGGTINSQDNSENKNVLVTHQHLNDNTIAGIELKNKKCFSVQYHPEAGPGPNDGNYLFDQFLSYVKSN